MRAANRKGRQLLRYGLSLVLTFLCLMTPGLLRAENVVRITMKTAAPEMDQLELTVPDTIRGFSENMLSILAPEAGELILTVSETDGTLRYCSREEVLQGAVSILWEGTAQGGQPLAKGTYQVEMTLRGQSGKVYLDKATCTLKENSQALLYAVPRSSVLYLNTEDTWYAEIGLVRSGAVVMDVYEDNGSDTVVARASTTLDNTGQGRLYWNGRLLDGRQALEGRYRLSFHLQGKTEKTLERILYIQDSEPEGLAIGVTGPVVPDRDMSDEQIWAIMMQPSVVVDYPDNENVTIRSLPQLRSSAAGIVHGQRQALQVMSIEDGWAHVRAWNQADGGEIDGYIQTSELKVAVPEGTYGLLIDKKTQTMAVFEKGQRIAQMQVSTGLAIKSQPNWETPAGSYLTDIRLTPEGNSGTVYACRIRYDVGRVICQSGYEVRNGSTVPSGEALLGSKALRGSIAMPLAADQDVNAWWLFTHLPQNTRIVILDDADEDILIEADQAEDGQQALTAQSKDETAQETDAPLRMPDREDRVLSLTISGEVELGETPGEDPAWTENMGLLSGLKEIFEADDLTIMTLGSVLLEDGSSLHEERPSAIFASPRAATLFSASGVDAVSVASGHEGDGHYTGRLETRRALKENGVQMLGGGYSWIFEKEGRSIGLMAFSASSYDMSAELTLSSVRSLAESGCDAVLVLVAWDQSWSSWHDLHQEEVARSLVEAGADLVCGVDGGIQGVSEIEGVPVIWSLGTLMYQQAHPISQEALLADVQLHFDDEGYVGLMLKFLPARVSGTEGENDHSPRLADDDEAERTWDELTTIGVSGGIVLDGMTAEDGIWFSAGAKTAAEQAIEETETEP